MAAVSASRAIELAEIGILSPFRFLLDPEGDARYSDLPDLYFQYDAESNFKNCHGQIRSLLKI